MSTSRDIELAKYSGFEYKICNPQFKWGKALWFYPPEGGVSIATAEPPDFTNCLNSCYKWVVPKLMITNVLFNVYETVLGIWVTKCVIILPEKKMPSSWLWREIAWVSEEIKSSKYPDTREYANALSNVMEKVINWENSLESSNETS